MPAAMRAGSMGKLVSSEPISDGWMYVHEASGDTNPKGPLNHLELRAMWARGEINADTLVWREGLEQWSTLVFNMVFSVELNGL
jgi:hypothetical protein